SLIRSGSERLTRKYRGRLMVRVSVTLGAGEARNQHVGTKCSYFPHQSSESYVMPAPFLERFRWRLRETEIGHRTEALFDTIEAIRFQQLQRTDYAELITHLTAELVLPT